MSKYCPYRDSNVVYTECQECEQKICGLNTFFCLVVGSRNFKDYKSLEKKLDKLLSNFSNVVIVSGVASGTDILAEEYAKSKDFPCLLFPVNWHEYGRSAEYIRDAAMHRFLSKQRHRGVVVFWDGKSHEIQHNFSLATQYHNTIRIFEFSPK